MASIRRSTRLSSIGGRVPTLTKENNCNVMNRGETSQQSSAARRSDAKALRPQACSKKRAPMETIVIVESDSSENQEEDKVSTKATVADLDVSPPKQPRQAKQPQASPSPSHLITRLTLHEQDSQPTCAQPKEPGTPKRKVGTTAGSKYQSARRVLNSSETQQLPGREQQLQQLTDFFQKHLAAETSASLYVSGQPGTGKTACLSLILRAPEFAQRLKCVYLNCTSIASVGGVYKKISGELGLQPSGRTERHYLAAIQQYLRTSRRSTVIVLDEIDQLCTARHAVLYTIFEWPALAGARLLLVGIANSLDLTDRVLNRLNAHCQLKPGLMHFPPYSKQQIVDIFKARLEEAGVLDVFPPVTLQLLAAKVSAVNGDVRRALDIGRRVVELAEQQKKAISLADLDRVVEGEGGDDSAQPVNEPVREIVGVKEVAAVLNTVYGASQNLQDDIEESFPLQQKLMLCSLMLILRNERNKDINMARLHDVYRRVCQKRNIYTLDQAEFSGLADLVETRGIVRVVRKKEPRLNRLLLQWDEEEVNGALKDKQLIASILDDTACLSRS